MIRFLEIESHNDSMGQWVSWLVNGSDGSWVNGSMVHGSPMVTHGHPDLQRAALSLLTDNAFSWRTLITRIISIIWWNDRCGTERIVSKYPKCDALQVSQGPFWTPSPYIYWKSLFYCYKALSWSPTSSMLLYVLLIALGAKRLISRLNIPPYNDKYLFCSLQIRVDRGSPLVTHEPLTHWPRTHPTHWPINWPIDPLNHYVTQFLKI